LQQLVREPTRYEYLLDLFLTDVAGAKVRVGPIIADHNFLLASNPLQEISDLQFSRSRFSISRVSWPTLRSALSDIDWSQIDRGSGDDAATYFMEILWFVLCTHIPYEQVAIKKKSHPWLNTRCEKAIKRKNDAEGSATFDDTRAECSQVLVEDYLKYIAKLKAQISKLKKGKQAMVALKPPIT